MNSELLLEAFSKIGDDPDCIQQLRKIAIALAVSGKLDKGAATLNPRQVLDAVDRVKADLAKRGIIPKAKKHAEVTLEQLPDAFSDTTRFAPLGELARIEKGQTGIQQAQPGAFPLVVTAAERATCDHFDFDGSAAIIPLVSSTGHGNASINRLHYQEGKFALGTILVAVFPHDPNLISARFLFEYLSAFKEELLVARMTGTANVTLSVGRVADVPIPLICPEVQRKVDELMALCDQLEQARAGREAVRDRLTIASLARLTAPDTDAETFQSHARFALQSLPTLTTRPDQIKTLRQTILNLAVRGKLVKKDIKGLNKECELESLVKIVRGSSPRPKGDSQYYGGPVPRLLIADITRDGKYVTPQLDSLTLEGAKLSRPMPKGSLVLAISGSYGVPAFLAVDACIHDGFIGFRDVSGDVYPEYLYLVMLFRRPYFDDVVKDSGLKNLTTEHLKRLVVPLPPLADQHRIVAKVDALMALCDQLEASLTTTATTRSKLLEALLHEALEPAAAPVSEAAE